MAHRLAFFDSFQPGLDFVPGENSKLLRLKVIGQGTISAKSDSHTGFSIRVNTEDDTKPNLYLVVTENSCMFYYGALQADILVAETTSAQTPQSNLKPFDEKYLSYPKGKNAGYLPKGTGPLKHWLSIDRTRGKLRYGRGYCTAALVLFEAELKYEDKKRVWKFFDNQWEWLHDLRIVEVSQSGGSGVSRRSYHSLRNRTNTTVLVDLIFHVLRNFSRDRRSLHSL